MRGEVRADKAEPVATVVELDRDGTLVGDEAADTGGLVGQLHRADVWQQLDPAKHHEPHLKQRVLQGGHVLPRAVRANDGVPRPQHGLRELEEVHAGEPSPGRVCLKATYDYSCF
jgi:hypothetical protein